MGRAKPEAARTARTARAALLAARGVLYLPQCQSRRWLLAVALGAARTVRRGGDDSVPRLGTRHAAGRAREAGCRLVR